MAKRTEWVQDQQLKVLSVFHRNIQQKLDEPCGFSTAGLSTTVEIHTIHVQYELVNLRFLG